MIKSMTGYGRCETAQSGRKFTVEIKSVNHRYLDINIRMPKKLGFFEASIRGELKKYISRGKVDVFISFEDFTENNSVVRCNMELAGEYLKYLRRMAQEFGLEDDVRVSTLSKFPEVFVMEEQGVDEEELWKELQRAVDGAAGRFVASRAAEGEHLKADLTAKLNGMLRLVDYVEERSPKLLAEYQTRIADKMRELLKEAPLDENRILTEVAVYADHICVDEETVRLRSHIGSTLAALSEGDGVGRKLDFIAQEMNREANTILSKANDLEISNCAIELKTEIEKVREQIQNIE